MKKQDPNVSCKFTISVDDGHVTDLRTAELLARYGLKGTFYVSPKNPERAVMSKEDIRQINRYFEIGSHGVNHRVLTGLADDELRNEVYGGKKWLEDVLGGPVMSFCYPRGKHDSRVARIVKEASFAGARTSMLNVIDAPSDPFRWGVTTQAYSHSTGVQVRHALLEANFTGLGHFVLAAHMASDWEQNLFRLIDRIAERGHGIAHLFLHSWEVDELRQWDKLDRVLAAVSSRKEFAPCTNGELFAQWWPASAPLAYLSAV
jgi:peptidoglycan/xylan/chitin deacetylase (PgdA/CDA1 family)